MSHYYYLITAGLVIDTASRICKVAVGTSDQANRDFLFLTSWAVMHNFYFELVSKESSDFILQVQKSLDTGHLEVEAFKARDLVRSIKTTGALPQKSAVKSSSLYQRAMLDANYLFFKNQR